MKDNVSLTTDYRLEPILLSLNDNNYKAVTDILLTGLLNYDHDLHKKISRYTYLVEQQNQKHVLSQETLKREFPGLILSDHQAITDNEELLDYTRIFVTQKQQRHISSKMQQISDKIRSQGLTEELVEEIYKYTSTMEVASDYKSIRDEFWDIYDNQVIMQGLSFLCPALDKLTGGIQPGTLCTILGGPGSMKTTYTSNIAYNALKQGKNVLYLSLEETPMQLYSKILSRSSVDVGKPLPKDDVLLGKLEDKDKQILKNEVKPYLDGLPGQLYIVGENDLSNYALTTLESKFKEIDRKAKEEFKKNNPDSAEEHGIDILVVDHIQLLKYAQAGLSEFSVINMYVSFLRQQCLSWLHEGKQISVIMLSQANREGIAYAQKHNGAYQMQHVAEASEIERASTYIISVYTDGMTQITKQLKVGAIKLRGSQLPLETIDVYAEGAYYQVGDTEIPETQDYSLDDITGTVKSDYNSADVSMDLSDLMNW